MLNRFATLSRTPSRTLALGFLAAALCAAPGCGADAADFNLESILVVNEDDKADKPQGTSALTWTRVSASKVQCIRFPCPSTIIHDVNVGVTQFVYQLDWRALHLSKTEESAANDSASKMLLYGRYTPVRVAGETMSIFQISRANLRVSDRSTDNPETERYYKVQSIGGQCPQAPCPTWRATPLGANVPDEPWASINLKRLQLSAAAEQTLVNELKAGQAYLSVSELVEQAAQVSQAFRPLKAEPLPR